MINLANLDWDNYPYDINSCVSDYITWNDLILTVLHKNPSGTYKSNVYINDDECYVGEGAGKNITSGSGIGNTLIGHDAGNDLTTGDYNTLIGMEALADEADVDNCVFIGYQAGKANSVNAVIGIGSGALVAGSGIYTTVIGHNAVSKGLTGQGITAMGYEAGLELLAGANCTLIGFRAGKDDTSGYNNTAIGAYSGESFTTGDFNTGIGYGSLRSATGGGGNTGLGCDAGGSATATISNCVYVGKEAGKNNTQSNIVAIGYHALISNVGAGNTAVGHQSMNGAIAAPGNHNTAFGFSTLRTNTTGYANTALGGQALTSNTTGYSNSGIGYRALFDNTTGNNNTAIGYKAGDEATATISGCVYLGYDAGSDNTVANTLWINNSNSAFPLIQGDFANDTVRFGDNSAAWNVQFVNSTLHLKERAEATAIANYGCIWAEADNTLHFKDGAGVEYFIDITPV